MCVTDRESYRRLQEIFLEASSLARDKRPEFLDRACAGDPVMRTEVEEMLAAESQVGTFLESPAVSPSSPKPRPGEAPDPTAIGPYRIEGELGRGGWAW